MQNENENINSSFNVPAENVILKTARKKNTNGANGIKNKIAKDDGNKARRLAVAILLVFLGIIFLARSFNLVSFDFFEGISLFWPLIFIFAGIFLTAKDGWWSIIISIFVFSLISVATILLAAGFFDSRVKGVDEIKNADNSANLVILED
ncbi:MAG: DUF5668 domain-containing protein [bacterium]